MKTNDLLDMIGEANDEFIHDAKINQKSKTARFPKWAKWSSAIAACLVLTVGASQVFIHMGGKSGGGGDTDLNYMHYVGPVMPLTVQGDSTGITASRNVNYDFSGYYTYQGSYENKGETVYYDRYDNNAYVTDTYLLENTTEEDKTVTMLYPFAGDLREWEYYPEISVEGETVSTVMHPGPYSGGFEGAWGSAEAGTVNLNALENFEGYQALLATEDYKNSAFDAFPELNQTAYVYRLHDFVYSKTTEDVNPTLSFTFHIDYERATVFSYSMNGASWDYESGYCSRRKGGIKYRPNVAPERQHPDDGYVILLGQDLDSYTLQGYKDGGCDEGEELNDLSCTVTRYETTLGEILNELLEDFLDESILQMDSLVTGKVSVDRMPLRELYLGLAAELLCTYGVIGDNPMERYDVGMLEDIFSAAMTDQRVIYLSFDVTIPAGKNITVEASMRKDASVDFVGKDKDRNGFDMATRLGSNLNFTKQTASISKYEEIEIVAQNFGFDLANDITSVTLDLNQEHYWMQVRKVKDE